MRPRLLRALVIVAMIATGCAIQSASLPLKPLGDISLPGDNSRFDYASLDAQRGLLYVAHLGASEVVEIDVNAGRVVRTIPNVSQVHGVLVVGTLGRVFVTATGTNQVVALDENTGTEIGRAPTGAYPDGLAYDPRRKAIWTTNEAAGTETVATYSRWAAAPYASTSGPRPS
jgi:DNA-binding beta-propeller fold protein YncE